MGRGYDDERMGHELRMGGGGGSTRCAPPAAQRLGASYMRSQVVRPFLSCSV